MQFLVIRSWLGGILLLRKCLYLIPLVTFGVWSTIIMFPLSLCSMTKLKMTIQHINTGQKKVSFFVIDITGTFVPSIFERYFFLNYFFRIENIRCIHGWVSFKRWWNWIGFTNTQTYELLQVPLPGITRVVTRYLFEMKIFVKVMWWPFLPLDLAKKPAKSRFFHFSAWNYISKINKHIKIKLQAVGSISNGETTSINKLASESTSSKFEEFCTATFFTNWPMASSTGTHTQIHLRN